MPAAIPPVECKRHHPLIAVDSITEAVKFYTTKLGFKFGFTWGEPLSFAGLNIGDVSVHLSSEFKNGGTMVYFVVGNADELYAFHRENNIEVVEPINDRPYELRDYRVRDPYGNELSFGHYIYNVGERIKIERIDVPVRLEKRLAALLADLADHKGMNINSCLEETLLHSFEPYGDGVASPHTQTTLQYIIELKRKHGIDYDTHGSYRFEE